MVIRQRGILMTAAAYVERAQRRGVLLRDIIAKRHGMRAKEASPLAARRASIGSGTFENICRGRLKGIGAHINDQLKRALTREILSEIECWTRELDQLLVDGADPGGSEVQEIVEMVRRLRSASGQEEAR